MATNQPNVQRETNSFNQRGDQSLGNLSSQSAIMNNTAENTTFISPQSANFPRTTEIRNTFPPVSTIVRPTTENFLPAQISFKQSRHDIENSDAGFAPETTTTDAPGFNAGIVRSDSTPGNTVELTAESSTCTNENNNPQYDCDVSEIITNPYIAVTDDTMPDNESRSIASRQVNAVEATTDKNSTNTSLDEDSSFKNQGCRCRSEISCGTPQTFTCAECSKRFSAICCLHHHVKEHSSEGSYYYDHLSQMAHPQLRQVKSSADSLPRQYKRSRRKIVSRGRPRKCKQGKLVEKKSDQMDDVEVSETCSKSRRNCNMRTSRKAKKHVKYDTAEGKELDPKTEERNMDLENGTNDLEMETSIREDSDGETKPETSQDSRPFKKRKLEKRSYALTKTNSRRGRKPSKVSNGNGAFGGEEPEVEVDKKEKPETIGGSIQLDTIKAAKPAAKPKKVEKKERFKTCEICGLAVTLKKWASHQKEHLGECPFVCEKCGKSFSKQRFLTKHLITHEVVKPWRCTICPAQFCQKTEFNIHKAVHEGNRPFVCNVCDKRFLSKKSLLTHQANIHMGLTHFECEVCSRRFFKKSSLIVHQATHFEATMKCSFCDKKFRDKTGLLRHERTHTGEKKFQCHVCKHGFIQSSPFWVHMEKRHGMCRTKLKEKLEAVKESNRRSGIPTDILVLPADQDKDILQTYTKPVKDAGKKPAIQTIQTTDTAGVSQLYNNSIGNMTVESTKFATQEITSPIDLHRVFSVPKTEVNAIQADNVHFYKQLKPAVLTSMLSASFPVSLSEEHQSHISDIQKPVIHSVTSLTNVQLNDYSQINEIALSLQRNSGGHDFKK